MNIKKAFTLVELLVVIAIIALLLAILMPALDMAMEMALRIQCGSNMRNSGLALGSYISMYDGKLPPCSYQTSGTPDDYIPWPGRHPDRPGRINEPFNSFWVVEHFDPSLGTAKERLNSAQAIRNLGLLYTTKLIKEPEVLYCPSAPRGKGGSVSSTFDITFHYDDYHDEGHEWPWIDPDIWGLGWRVVRSSFCYLPQHVNREGTVGGVKYPLMAKRATDLAPGRALAVDTIHTLGALSHKTGALNRGRGLNLMYSDFSIRFVTNQEAFRSYLWQTGGTDIPLGDDEEKFRRVVRLLEQD